MHILYLVIDEFDIVKESGVSRKISSKISSFKEHNADITLLSVKKDLKDKENSLTTIQDKGVQFSIGVKDYLKGRLNKISSNRYFYSQLSLYIKTLSFDKIIFRYPGASHGLFNFTKTFKGQIFFEHNTIEIDEARLYEKGIRKIKFSLRPSLFMYWFQEKKMAVLSEKYLAPFVLKYAAGGICITDEIAAHEKTKLKCYKTIVSGNGFQFNDLLPCTKSFTQGDKLIIGFVISSDLPWFGLNRIYNSLIADNTNSNVEIRIAGISENANIIHPKLKYFGYLSEAELIDFYKGIHVSFGPMALYKKNLEYASALKIKESIAYGIPFVIGYKEQGISNNDNYKNYFIELSNDDTLIEFPYIYSFAISFYKDPENSLKLYREGKNDFSFNVITKMIIHEISKLSLPG